MSQQPGPADPHATAGPAAPRPRRLLPGWRSLAWVTALAAVAAVAFLPITHNTYLELLGETLFVGVALLLAFRWAGAWQQARVPRWLAQLIAVGVAAALAPLVVQLLTAGGDFGAFIGSRPHVRGYVLVTLSAAIIGCILALGALYRERDAQARSAALELALMRETLQRQTADARLHLLTAQIQPHFLLNTLANVQALVESGSPRAVPLFRSLIDYLRAAVPHLQRDAATLADEERLVQAYLALMQMRMPDRLSYALRIDPALRSLRFPPLALLTLVENAIHHGIDAASDPGEVEVGGAPQADGSVRLWVADTGVGLAETAGEGSGLANLRARLRAFFGDGARLELSEVRPHGVRAEIVLPPGTAAGA